MKIRRIKILVANGWFKTICLVSYSLLSLLSGNASAQEKKDNAAINLNSLYQQERNQGMRARAYGPQYPQDKNPFMVLDGEIVDIFSVDVQCLDSLMSGKLEMDKKNIARLFGIKERDIQRISVLKDEAATAEWGFRGINGVIEVTTKRMAILMAKDADSNKYAWESINEEILKMSSKTELNSLPGEGLYIPSDHATYYSIEDFYNNWILK